MGGFAIQSMVNPDTEPPALRYVSACEHKSLQNVGSVQVALNGKHGAADVRLASFTVEAMEDPPGQLRWADYWLLRVLVTKCTDC